MPSQSKSPFICSTSCESVVPPSGFSGLYYPYADVRNPELFLLSCILFDHVYVLAPQGYGSQNRSYREFSLKLCGDESIARKIPEVDTLLIGHDVVRPISTQRQATEHTDLILANIRSDLADSDPYANYRKKYLWELYFCNPPFCAEFYELCAFAHGISKPQNFKDWIHASMLPQDGYPDMRSEWKRTGGADWDGGFVIERRQNKMHVRLHRSEVECIHRIIVPYTVGESLMISHALIACAAYGLVPFTDNSIHHEFLSKKIRKSYELPNTQALLKDYGPPHSVKAASLATEIFKETLIPVGDLTPADVIRLREECGDSLKRFRVYMAALGTKLKRQFWEDGFEKEVVDVVKGEIVPSLIALRDQMTVAREKLLTNSIKKVLLASPLSMITTAFVGIPLELALAASAGVGVATSFLDYYMDRKKTQRHDLAILLKLERGIH